MNKAFTIILIFILLNFVFSVIPFLFPATDKSAILPYQLWFNVLLLFIIILPNVVVII